MKEWNQVGGIVETESVLKQQLDTKCTVTVFVAIIITPNMLPSIVDGGGQNPQLSFCGKYIHKLVWC